MQATCWTKVLDKPLAPHQYSQWVPSFKTPYSCKLHKQIVIDHGGGVSLDSQSKQLYIKSKPLGWILSHARSQRLNRHVNSMSATVSPLRCTGIVKGPCNIFFPEVERWARRCTSAGCLPSQPKLRSLQSFLISILLQSHRNLLKIKNEIGGFCMCVGSV